MAVEASPRFRRNFIGVGDLSNILTYLLKSRKQYRTIHLVHATFTIHPPSPCSTHSPHHHLLHLLLLHALHSAYAGGDLHKLRRLLRPLILDRSNEAVDEELASWVVSPNGYGGASSYTACFIPSFSSWSERVFLITDSRCSTCQSNGGDVIGEIASLAAFLNASSTVTGEFVSHRRRSCMASIARNRCSFSMKSITPACRACLGDAHGRRKWLTVSIISSAAFVKAVATSLSLPVAAATGCRR